MTVSVLLKLIFSKLLVKTFTKKKGGKKLAVHVKTYNLLLWDYLIGHVMMKPCVGFPENPSSTPHSPLWFTTFVYIFSVLGCRKNSFELIPFPFIVLKHHCRCCLFSRFCTLTRCYLQFLALFLGFDLSFSVHSHDRHWQRRCIIHLKKKTHTHMVALYFLSTLPHSSLTLRRPPSLNLKATDLLGRQKKIQPQIMFRKVS